MFKPTNVEPMLERSEANGGYALEWVTPITLWRDNAGPSVPLDALTSPALIQRDSHFDVIEFDTADDPNNFISLDFIASEHFVYNNNGDANSNGLVVAVRAAKFDSAAIEEAAGVLKIQGQVFFQNVGEAIKSLTTVALSAALDDATAMTGGLGFREYTVDLGARLRAESTASAPKVIKPGAKVKIQIGPNGTVGVTDQKLRFDGLNVRMRSHISLNDRDKRNF